VQFDVVLHIKSAIHREESALNSAKEKHVKHLEGMFYSQVAHSGSHFNLHFFLSEDKTYPS
jgi:hypothetical protein